MGEQWLVAGAPAEKIEASTILNEQRGRLDRGPITFYWGVLFCVWRQKMNWVLIVWIYGFGPSAGATSITSQEFASRANCVKTARAIQDNLGQSMGFLCVEKGKAK